MASLRNKVGLGYAVIVLFSVLTSVIALVTLSQLGDTVGTILRENYNSVIAAETMVKAVQRQENAQISMFVGDIDLATMMLRENRDEFLRGYELALTAIALPAEPLILDSIMTTYRDFQHESDTLLAMMERGVPLFMARNFQFSVVRPTIERLKEHCFHLLEVNQNAIHLADQRGRSRSLEASTVILFASIVSILLSFGASVYFTRSIVRPVSVLTESVRHIGQGALEQKIDLRSDDEIGELSREFNKMTERLRMYEEMNVQKLISEKRTSEAIITSISDPIIVTDDTGRIVMLNDAARKTIPFAASREPVGCFVRDVVSDARWASRLSASEHIDEQSVVMDLLVLGSGEEAQYFRPRHRMIPSVTGTLPGVVTLLQDVTRFTQIDRMKSEFLAAVSHEFRTPLTSINMTVDILQQNVLGDLNPRQQDLLVAAKADTGRLRKLVQELLDLSKLESGQDRLAPIETDLTSIVREAVDPLLLQFEARGIALVTDIPLDLPHLKVDPHKLAWVVTNLVSNALRYTGRGGVIQIAASHGAAMLRVSVQDSGRGIPPNALESIFEPFVQIKQDDESTPGSVGLGLAIARRIVEAHGGEIHAASDLGVGSTFTFTIPSESPSAS